MDDPQTKGPLSLRDAYREVGDRATQGRSCREGQGEGIKKPACTCPYTSPLVYDAKRTARLEGLGYRVMRFWNHEVMDELQVVLEQIRTALIEAPSPQPSPGGRGS